jgi:type IV pilus assembly protein PilA
MMKKLKRKKGFTLIELIIVIAIIGVLSAIAVPKYVGIQKNAKVKADIASAKVIADATNMLIGTDELTIATYAVSEGAVLGDKIDGYLQTVPVAMTVKDGVFKVMIDSITNNVKVTINSLEVYPVPTGIYAPSN